MRIFFLLLYTTLASAQPFSHAHAHNDYEHDHPLFDALQNGFTSVEADIYLVDGKLLVSHTRPIFRARTLDQLYLSPLDSIVKANQGKVYPGYNGPFYLMIDIKSDGQATYPVLKEAIAHYSTLFQSPAGAGPVIIFLSGNRPREAVLKDPDAPVALDGRPEDVGKGYAAAVMPVISDTYGKWSTWNGKGRPAPEALQRIKNLAQRVHAEGKKLRLWAIPDNPDAWKELLEAGVDLINTDNLEELNQFLKAIKN
jgi:glycerophosphoryl diester phosphodiesterase